MESGNDFEFLPPPKFPDFSGEIERMKDALMKAHGVPARLISISERPFCNVRVSKWEEYRIR
jgi:hypothetical protein